jgi:RNA-directed DNA polymerase
MSREVPVRFCEGLGVKFPRATRLLVFTKTSQASQRVYQSVERYLTGKLKLVVNHQKSSTRPTDGIEFLGYRFEGYGGQYRVSPKNIDKFKKRVKEITCRKRGVSIDTRFEELSDYLRGWVGYFALVPIKSFFRDLDKWIRRRIRSCYWKQWRKPRTRIAKLLSLGLPRNEAVPFGSCSRGFWHMSRCSSVQRTLNGDWLASAGLVSLLDIWNTLAPKFRTA